MAGIHQGGGFQPPLLGFPGRPHYWRALYKRATECGLALLLRRFRGFVGDADFLQPVAQRIAGKTKYAGGFALISVGPAVGLADKFVFPLVERFALGQKRGLSEVVAVRRVIQLDVAHSD